MAFRPCSVNDPLFEPLVEWLSQDLRVIAANSWNCLSPLLAALATVSSRFLRAIQLNSFRG